MHRRKKVEIVENEHAEQTQIRLNRRKNLPGRSIYVKGKKLKIRQKMQTQKKLHPTEQAIYRGFNRIWHRIGHIFEISNTSTGIYGKFIANIFKIIKTL
jgi:hypothetical protein